MNRAYQSLLDYQCPRHPDDTREIARRLAERRRLADEHDAGHLQRCVGATICCLILGAIMAGAVLAFVRG